MIRKLLVLQILYKSIIYMNQSLFFLTIIIIIGIVALIAYIIYLLVGKALDSAHSEINECFTQKSREHFVQKKNLETSKKERFVQKKILETPKVTELMRVIEPLVITNSMRMNLNPSDQPSVSSYFNPCYCANDTPYYRADLEPVAGIPGYYLEETEPGETEENDYAGYQQVIMDDGSTGTMNQLK